MVLVGCAALVGPVAAAHASADALIADCVYDEVIDGTYSAQDYATALANLAADVSEYSPCIDAIRAGQLALANKRAQGKGDGSTNSGTGGVAGGGSGTGGGPPAGGPAYTATHTRGDAALDAASPEARAAVEGARRAPAAAVPVGGLTLRPDEISRSPLRRLNALPLPIMLALGGLGLAGVLTTMGAAAGWLGRRRRVLPT